MSEKTNSSHSDLSKQTVKPWVSVVAPTCDRPKLLRQLLDSLAAQSLNHELFEVIVVNDCSTATKVSQLLDEYRAASKRKEFPELRVIDLPVRSGPSVARNAGWKLAKAELVAFIDDDCVASRGWLEGLIDSWRRGEARQIKGAKSEVALPVSRRSSCVIVGPVEPNPAEYPAAYGPFSTSLWVKEPGPRFETANIAYPRALLEQLNGFDESLVMAGEDTDLGWRALESGAAAVWAEQAQVFHAVVQQGAWGKLKKGWRWRFVPAVYARHPGLRSHLIGRLFWGPQHWGMFRALLAALLPGSSAALAATVASSDSGLGRRASAGGILVAKWWLAFPYVRRLTHYRSGPLLAPYRFACDLVEVVAIIVGAVKSRVWMF